jgi:hypothetical protein
MTLLILAIVWLTQSAGADKDLRSATTVSVCDVLAHDPVALNGKILRVRGNLAATDEGTWLIDECQTHLITKGLTWGDTLSIYVNESDQDILRSWEQMSENLKQLGAYIGRDKIWVTVVGRLETRASMDEEVVQMPYGPRRAGFGHMGDAPAELNVIAVEDVTIGKEPHNKPK